MKRRACLLLTLFFGICAAALASPPASKFDFHCGLYRLRGKLALDSGANRGIWIFPGTRNRRFYSIPDLPGDEVIALENAWVEIEVRVRTGGGDPILRWNKRVEASSPQAAMRDPVGEVARESCAKATK